MANVPLLLIPVAFSVQTLTDLRARFETPYPTTVEKERDRSIVHQIHLHIGAEAAYFNRKSLTPKRCFNSFVQNLRLFRRRGGAEIRPASLGRIPDQSKLGNEQNCPFNISNRPVHFPGLIGEDTQRMDLVGDILHVLLAVSLCHTEQSHQTASDSADNGSAHFDRGL